MIPAVLPAVLHTAVMATVRLVEDEGDKWSDVPDDEQIKKVAWAWRAELSEFPEMSKKERRRLKKKPLIKDDYFVAERALAFMRGSSLLHSMDTDNLGEDLKDERKRERITKNVECLLAEIHVAAIMPLKKGGNFDPSEFGLRVNFEMKNIKGKKK